MNSKGVRLKLTQHYSSQNSKTVAYLFTHFTKFVGNEKKRKEINGGDKRDRCKKTNE